MDSTLYTNFRWGYDGVPQAMLVKRGRVIERSSDLLTADSRADSRIVDLENRFVLPKFVESHCHILPAGLDLMKLSLEAADSHATVLDFISQWHNDHPEGWLLAVQYDQNRYGGVHLTRQQLDAISTERPILLRHASGHAGVANTRALMAAGIDDAKPDPPGGSFGRGADGLLNGTLFETANDLVAGFVPGPSREEMVEAILRIGKIMAGQGIGCATDMLTGRFDLEDELFAYQEAVRLGCDLHIRLFVNWSSVFGSKGCGVDRLRDYGMVGEGDTLPIRAGSDAESKTCLIAGIKIFADGAIGSGTAAIYGRYSGREAAGAAVSLSSGQGGSSAGREVSGQLIYSPERLQHMVRTAHDAGMCVATHSIGDYSTDLVMDAYETTGEASRHRIEHAMLLSDAQIERMASLGMHCTFQPEFLLRFVGAYVRQLGADRAANLLRTRSVLNAGIPLSFSSDRPIVAGDPWDGIRAAACRPAGFSGFENCTIEEALRAYTEQGSAANGEPGLMGSLKAGALAEFQVLESAPWLNRG